MKIYAKIKDVDKWIKFTENLIKKHTDNENYKKILVDLKQKRFDLANEIGQNISKNRSKFFKKN